MQPAARVAAALLLPLAGCLDGPLSFDPPGTAEARSPDLPGLLLRTAVAKTEGGLRLSALLINEGSRTFQASSICVSPWSTHLTDDRGRNLTLKPPQPVCAAFGLAPLPPGAKRWENWTWEGDAWDGGKGPFHPTPGMFAWHARFVAYTGTGLENPGDAIPLQASLYVRVG